MYARDEGQKLKYMDVEEFQSENKSRLTEISTKKRTGARPLGHKRAFNPRTFSTCTERCPVISF